MIWTNQESSLKKVGCDVGANLQTLSVTLKINEIGSGNIGGQYVMDDVQGHWQTWQASRAAIELDIDWPESNDDFWKDGEEGAYAMGYMDGRDKTVIAVMKAIRAAGIKEKNFD